MSSENETRYILVGTRGEEANTMISKHRGFEDALDAKRFGTKICVVKNRFNFQKGKLWPDWKEYEWQPIEW